MRRLPNFPASPAQLDLFVGVGGHIAARDAQDLMAWPFFSLAKSKRVRPIDFRMGEVSILVEATAEHGMATIWDADVLIWVASQIVEARDMGRPTSRLIAATPHEILAFTRRGTGKASYERLKAGLDRLQSTTVATSIRQLGSRRRHRFSWINEWKERLDGAGRARGIEMIILLIPQGARLIGDYAADIAFGQSRVLLAWNRLILPDGRSIVLERQPASDPRGYAGLQDGIDGHWGGVLKAALVSTLLGAGSELGSGDDGNLARALRRGTQDSVGRAGEQIVSRELNVRPTLTIRPGFPVRVLVTRDLVLGAGQ